MRGRMEMERGKLTVREMFRKLNTKPEVDVSIATDLVYFKTIQNKQQMVLKPKHSKKWD